MSSLEELREIIAEQKHALEMRDLDLFQDLLCRRVEAQVSLRVSPPQVTEAVRRLVEEMLLMDRAVEEELHNMMDETNAELRNLVAAKNAARSYLCRADAVRPSFVNSVS